MTVTLIGSWGVTGVGVAYLTSEGVVAAVVAIPLLRSLREPEAGAPPPHAGVLTPVDQPAPIPPTLQTDAAVPGGRASGVSSLKRTDDV
jgi:hypothetical protein